MCKKTFRFFNVLLAMLANVSPSAKEATTGAMRARTEVGGVCFTYMACPCVRCVATESPHAGLACCIAPVVAVVALTNCLLIYNSTEGRHI